MPSLEIVKAAIEKNPDALILTHIGGYPNPEISKIAELCKKKNVLLIRYDDFAERTKKELVKISKFLNCKTSSFTKKCLKFNNVPRVIDIDSRKEKKRIISKLINNNFYEKVESITEKYESKTLF